ncbi:MAG: hypothetical protein V1758_15440 [Pseudomonadota bacterium]
MSKRTKEILFLFFLLALMVIIVGRSTHYSIKSYLLPVLVGIPVCILIIVQIVREFLSGKEPDAKGKKTPQGSGLFAGLSVIGLILLIYLAGFMVAVPVGVFAYIMISGEKWYLALGLGLIMLLIVFVLQGLGLYLYEGILLS